MTAAAIQPHTSRVPGVDEIRARFPALERVHGGHLVAYFDAPGGTQVPASVVDAMRDYLLHHNSNSHWAYPTSFETDEIIDEARAAAADFLNSAPNEIVFGANMTTLAFSLSRALAPTFAPGDEIVVTELDHHANVAPWTRLAAERGAVVRMARMNTDTGALDWAHLEQQLTARTRLLAIGASSNVLGTITDVARATALAHARGALVFIDAVAHAPHALIDVRALDCDFLACSQFKFYGPHLGMLYGRHDLLASLDVARLAPAPAQAPDRWETGTLNFEALAGTTAAIEFMASLGGDSAGARDGRRARLARVRRHARAHRAAVRNAVERARRYSRREALRSAAGGCAALADGFVHRRRHRLARGRNAPGQRVGRVRVQREFLRRHHRGALRDRRLRMGARGMRLLHDRGRNRAPCERRARHFGFVVVTNGFFRDTSFFSNAGRNGSYTEPGLHSTQPS